MRDFLFTCLINNLKLWMEIEESETFRNIYVDFYDEIVEEKAAK